MRAGGAVNILTPVSFLREPTVFNVDMTYGDRYRYRTRKTLSYFPPTTVIIRVLKRVYKYVTQSSGWDFILLLRASRKIIMYIQYIPRDRLDRIRFNVSEQQYAKRKDLPIWNKLRKFASVNSPDRQCQDANNVSIICKRN